MPLSRIEIVQTAIDRWVAEVEVGGSIARRTIVRGSSFEEVLISVEDAYRALTPRSTPSVESAKTEKPAAHQVLGRQSR